MLFAKRVWAVRNVESAAKLAELLTQFNWTGCTGFRLGGYLFLNDATSPDGAQEYGIVREKDGLQVESVTISWCTQEQAQKYIEAAVRGEYDGYAWESGIDIARQVQTPAEHGRCHLCA